MISKERFITQYRDVLLRKKSTLFVGAGLSKAAGYPDWRGLLSKLANELQLDVYREKDLAMVAEFHASHSNSRSSLRDTIHEHIATRKKPAAVHELLAALPFQHIWTTNYDNLIEDALVDKNKTPKIISSEDDITSISLTNPSDVLIFKMHGSIGKRNLVISTEDFENYNTQYPSFLNLLHCAAVNSSILFLGISFSDPNLKNILSRIRSNYGAETPTHYTIARRPNRVDYDNDLNFEYDLNWFSHWTKFLNRYGIQSLVVDDYDEVEDIIRVLKTRFEESNPQNESIAEHLPKNINLDHDFKTISRFIQKSNKINIYKKRLLEIRINKASKYVNQLELGKVSISTLDATSYSSVIFAGFMSTLGENEQYFTVSNINFWYEKGLGSFDFLDENIKAVEKGVDIKRVLLIDNTMENDLNYKNHIKTVLNEHVKRGELCAGFKGSFEVVCRYLDHFENPHPDYGHFGLAIHPEKGHAVIVEPDYSTRTPEGVIKRIDLTFSNRSDTQSWNTQKEYLDRFNKAFYSDHTPVWPSSNTI